METNCLVPFCLFLVHKFSFSIIGRRRVRGNGQEVDTRRPAQEEGESGQFHQHHGRMMVGERTERQGTRRYSLTVVYLASPARISRVVGPELRAWAEELLMLGLFLLFLWANILRVCEMKQIIHGWTRDPVRNKPQSSQSVRSVI